MFLIHNIYKENRRIKKRKELKVSLYEYTLYSSLLSPTFLLLFQISAMSHFWVIPGCLPDLDPRDFHHRGRPRLRGGPGDHQGPPGRRRGQKCAPP